LGVGAIELLKDLVSIKSENPGCYEYEIADFISHLLKKHDIEYEVIYSGNKRVNIVGFLYGESDHVLILNGHLDTKPAKGNWRTDPYTPVIKNNKLYGLGASDMKGGLAAMLSAVIRSKGKKLKGTINFQFVADEEMNSEFGMKYLVKNGYIKNGDFAIVGEPTNLKVATRSLGNLWLVIKVRGRKAHAGMYWEGISAIDRSIEIIDEIKSSIRKYRYKNDPEISNFPNVNVGYINGGFHPGTVPDYCEFSIDIRFRSEQEREIFKDMVNKTVTRILFKYDCECEIEPFGGGDMFAWDLASFENIDRYLDLIDQSYYAIIKQAAQKCVFLGGSDASSLVYDLGIPTVIIGPGSLKQAHNNNEWVFIDEVVNASKIYEEIISRWE